MYKNNFNMSRRDAIKLSVAATVALLVSGCGSGSGSENSGTNTNINKVYNSLVTSEDITLKHTDGSILNQRDIDHTFTSINIEFKTLALRDDALNSMTIWDKSEQIDVILSAVGDKSITLDFSNANLKRSWKYMIKSNSTINNIASRTLSMSRNVDSNSIIHEFITNTSFSTHIEAVKSQVIFISDIHMNNKTITENDNVAWFKDDDAKLLDKFLRSIVDDVTNVKEIVILGDLFDTWLRPSDEHDNGPADFDDIHTGNTDTMQSLITTFKYVAQNMPLIYVPGNHDMGLTEEKLKAIIPEIIYKGTNHGIGRYTIGNDIVCEHGNIYDYFNAPINIDTYQSSLMKENDDFSFIPPGYGVTRALAQANHYGNRAKNNYIRQKTFELLLAHSPYYIYVDKFYHKLKNHYPHDIKEAIKDLEYLNVHIEKTVKKIIHHILYEYSRVSRSCYWHPVHCAEETIKKHLKPVIEEYFLELIYIAIEEYSAVTKDIETFTRVHYTDEKDANYEFYIMSSLISVCEGRGDGASIDAALESYHYNMHTNSITTKPVYSFFEQYEKYLKEGWHKTQSDNGVNSSFNDLNNIPISTLLALADQTCSFGDLSFAACKEHLSKDYKIAVFGHTHLPMVKQAQDATILKISGLEGIKLENIYANSGTWVNRPLGTHTHTYTVIDVAEYNNISDIHTVSNYYVKWVDENENSIHNTRIGYETVHSSSHPISWN
ncbi:MAG: hypothetical protein KAJ49_10940 [Arcobacteraceae bacterium]|nr:hypothetical protein [Arcobacteraceae bacterium]